MSRSTGKFILGGLLGGLAGAIGGLLLAPKSGKETRAEILLLANKLTKVVKSSATETKERVEEVFGATTKIAIKKYEEIKQKVTDKVAAVKAAGDEIDKEKYGLIVEDVVDEYKADLETTKDGVKKLVKLLKSDWTKFKRALN